MNTGGKCSFEAEAGSRFLVLTPGGGGYGPKSQRITKSGDDKNGQKDTQRGISGSLNTFKKLQEQA